MNQRGGIIFKNIVTMENKGQLIGMPVKIVRLDDFDDETLADPINIRFMPFGSDLYGHHTLSLLQSEAGFIAEDDAEALETIGHTTPFVDVYYPNLEDMVPIAIPENLNDLAHRENGREQYNYYLETFNRPIDRSGILKSGDLFTAKRMKKLNKSALGRRRHAASVRHVLTSGNARGSITTDHESPPIHLPHEIMHEISKKIPVYVQASKKVQRKKKTRKRKKKTRKRKKRTRKRKKNN